MTIISKRANSLIKALSAQVEGDCLSDLHGLNIDAHLYILDDIEANKPFHCFEINGNGLRNMRFEVVKLYKVQGMEELAAITANGQFIVLRKVDSGELDDMRKRAQTTRHSWGRNNGRNRH